MIVIVAKSAGFCMGVRRAMDMALGLAESCQGDLYTMGPLVHNRQAVEFLEAKGIVSVQQPSGLSKNKVLIRTHGVTPQKREELARLGCEIHDATCPFVRRSQKIIERHVKKGYEIIIVGDKGHAEIEGLIGFARGKAHLVKDLAGAESLAPMENACILAQTTFNKKSFEEIVKKLFAAVKNPVVYDTICPDTGKRQSEAAEIAAAVEAIVVVGGKNSANTARLAEIAAKHGLPTYKIESEEELDRGPLSRYASVGVLAGASTPDWVIEKVVERLRNI